MMRGYVVGEQARLEVSFLVPGLRNETIEFIIDTGFEGALTLPLSVITKLGLPLQQNIVARLADGSEVEFGSYRGVISWQGVSLAVAVIAMESNALLGTSLLKNNLLLVDWVDGGQVRVDARP